MRCGHRGEFGLRWKETGSLLPLLFKCVLSALPSNCAQTRAVSPRPPRTPPPTWVIAITPHGPPRPSLTIVPLVLFSAQRLGGAVMLEIASLLRMQPWLPSHQSPIKAPCDLAPVISDRHVLPSSPHLLQSGHAGLLPAPHTPGMHLPRGLYSSGAVWYILPFRE